MRRNRVRELLKAGKPTLSTRMVTLSPQIAEIIGHTGAFDFIELCGEEAAWTLPDLENFARAVDLFPNMSTMMKIEKDPRLFITQRALGAGIQNLLFADVDSAEQVRQCIRYVRAATPQDGGLNGAGSRRNVGYVLESGSDAWIQAMRDVVIDVMIESASAMEQLEDILDLEGVDMVHFGGADYSLSVGKAAGKLGAEGKRLQRHLIETALKKGKRARVILGSLDDAKEYVEMGVRDFNIGTDFGSIYRFCKTNGEKMRDLLATV